MRETGDRSLLGFAIGASEEATFWLSFLRSQVQRGLQGVQLVISDSHAGLRMALSQVLAGATWQCCRVQKLRNIGQAIRLADDLPAAMNGAASGGRSAATS